MKIKDKDLYKDTILSELLPIRCTPNLNFLISSLDYVHEPTDKNDDMAQLSLIIKSNHHKIQDHKIIFNGLNSEARKDLTKKFGIDIDTEIQFSLIKEIKNFIIEDYLTKVRKLADKTSPLYIGFIQKILGWIYSVFNKIYRPVLKIKNGRNFIQLLMAYSNIIAQSTRRGPGSFVIMSTKMAMILQDELEFKPSIDEYDTDNYLYHIGNIMGLKIYVDTKLSFNDNIVIMGKANNDGENPGLFMGYKKYATKIKEVLSDDTSVFMINANYTIVEHGQKPELMFRKILVTV